MAGNLTCSQLVSSYIQVWLQVYHAMRLDEIRRFPENDYESQVLVCVQRISAYDRLTNAVREIVPDVMNTAASMDVMLAAYNANGTTLPMLFCVPILTKDNFDTLDGRLFMTCVQTPYMYTKCMLNTRAHSERLQHHAK